MTSPVIALRAAMRQRLLADAALLAALGSPKIYDTPPREATAPWISFGETRMRDWSSLGTRGVDLTIQIDAWSLAPGSREALDLAERVAALLDDADMALDGWRLTRLAFVALDARRETVGRFCRATTRLRALVEAL
ncbi:MAG: DUF3168 domain-containing protein [Methylobacteriaceae bacterium]|nr:DUF3168 domain-containing protein [Methylobacteriaceae bacterium]